MFTVITIINFRYNLCIGVSSQFLGWCLRLHRNERSLFFVFTCGINSVKNSFVTSYTVARTDFVSCRVSNNIHCSVWFKTLFTLQTSLSVTDAHSYFVSQFVFKLVPFYEISIIDKLWITKCTLQINTNFAFRQMKRLSTKNMFYYIYLFLFPDLSRFY